MSHFTRKATLGAVAFALVGSTVFGGAALAGDKEKDFHHKKDEKKVVKVHKGGDGGDATATSNCTAEVFGGVAHIDQTCTAIAVGGDGGAGAEY